MKPERITYRKTFNLGNYTSEAIGVDIILDDTDDPIQALRTAKELVEEYHRISSPEVPPEFNGPLPVIQQETKPLTITEQLIKYIGTCSDIKVLESYSIMVRSNPALKEAYDKKMNHLTRSK